MSIGHLCLFWILLVLSAEYSQGRYHGDVRPQQYPPRRHNPRLQRKSETLSVWMPGVSPLEDDDYWCTSVDLQSVSPNAYITQFETKADGAVAHHIILFACAGLAPEVQGQKAWRCLGSPMCKGQQGIIFAWAKNADATSLPKDVGFDVGAAVDKRYLVMQVHYAHKGDEAVKDTSGLDLTIALTPPKFSAGIYLMVAWNAQIPPHNPTYHVDVNCLYEDKPINVFAYRVHAHSLGSVITGYRYSSDLKQIEQLAKGNPNWPQAFYPMNPIKQISPNDWVAARCTYNSTLRNTVTSIGSKSGDEMCNLYLMFYAERNKFPSIITCGGENVDNLAARLPADSDKPLPPNPLLEMIAHGHGGRDKQVEEDKKVLEEERGHQLHHDALAQGPGEEVKAEMDGEKRISNLGFELVKNWPNVPLDIGQPTAVYYTSDGTLMVFHRGDRLWDEKSFDESDNYLQRNLGPIQDDTVIEMDPETGKIIRKWGSSLFYMPHGIFVDHLSNTWLTDVALHQVFKFTQNDLKTPAMILGIAFAHASDKTHFCKPAAVTVSKLDGSVFVADGYCNSRVVKFDSKGNFVAEWGTPSDFATKPAPGSWVIPHSIVTIEDRGVVCAADRENSRVQCLDVNTGDVRSVFYMPVKTGAYAISHSPDNGGRLWVAASMMDGPTGTWTGTVYVFEMNTQKVIGRFGTLQRTHDLTVDEKSGNVYVADLGKPFRISRFFNPNYTATEKESLILEPIDEPLFGKLPKTVQQILNSSMWDTITPLLIATLLAAPVLAILSVTICIRLRRRKAVAESQKVWWKEPKSRNRNGFRKLRQEDTIALNSDDATSNSENDDILYTASHQPKRQNSKAKC